MRSVCGCMPTRSAATLIMYLGRSSLILTPLVGDGSRPAKPGLHRRLRRWRQDPALASLGCTGGLRPGDSSERLLARALARHLLELLQRLALGLRELRRDSHAHTPDQVAPARPVQPRSAVPLHAQEPAVLRTG